MLTKEEIDEIERSLDSQEYTYVPNLQNDLRRAIKHIRELQEKIKKLESA